ncbi:hypothetical protein [Spirosoma fluminis]
MDISKFFNLLTPLIGVAIMGVIMIGYGFVNPKQDNNILQFLFGIPIMAGALGLHWVVRRMTHNNTLSVWIIESILVGFMVYVFLRS